MEFDGTEYNKQFFPDPKPEKPIRLKGKALQYLYNAIWIRDNGLCQVCFIAVCQGTPPHHKRFKSKGGSDTMENLITICPKCHNKIHHINGK